MSSAIERSIEAALDARHAQIGTVTRLAELWAVIRSAADQLATSAPAVEAAAARTGLPGATQQTAAELRTVLQEAFGPGGSLHPRMAAIDLRITAVVARAHRDTVNLGVIGLTKAGKTTLLRSITGLDDDNVLPARAIKPTTAASSRIYHDRSGTRAEVRTYDWDSFRADVLVPLYREAAVGGVALGEVPHLIDAWLRVRYPEQRGLPSGASVAVQRLLQAQESVGSYRGLLSGPGTVAVEPLNRLASLVSRPADDQSRDRPYLAVRDVVIRTPFAHVDSVRLGLIDLPGAGEASLDVEKRFLEPLRHEVDLFMMVIRPVKSQGFVRDFAPTRQVIQLADKARLGVRLTDFLTVVVNDDGAPADQQYVDSVMADLAQDPELGDIPRYRINNADGGAVASRLLEPVLQHLARRLAAMDAATVTGAVAEADAVLADAAAVIERADELADRIRSVLPLEKWESLRRAKELSNRIASGLKQVVDEYDSVVSAGKADPRMHKAITTAREGMRTWAMNGLGYGSREGWLQARREAFSPRDLETVQDEFVRVRLALTEHCDAIDVGLESSIQRLWRDVATVLRTNLGSTLVPAEASNGRTPLESLAVTARKQRANQLAVALADLAAVKVAYGSIVLRVTRPLIRTIDWRNSAIAGPAGHGPGVTIGFGMGAGPIGATVDVGRVDLNEVATKLLGTVGRGVARGPAPDTATVTGYRSEAPIPTQPGPVSPVPRVLNSVEDLYDELQAMVLARIDQMTTALDAEAATIATVLAAAADRFLDAAGRADDIEQDYDELCAPVRAELWPDLVDAGGPATGLLLDEVREAGRRVRDAADRFQAAAAAAQAIPR
ncbi:hypothetical protein [Dactylosporangium sp. CA-092794]|uniref:hypothetical protein n=1 Tax=Dactylosporangium sp. CA-092794 TaxID=3239929 RepID=UPI003D92FC48